MIMRTLRRTTTLLRPDEGDPVPASLIASSVVVSGAAITVGGIIDWTGLLANVAANLALLGPGLVVTNVILKARERLRIARRARPAVAAILAEMRLLPQQLQLVARTIGRETATGSPIEIAPLKDHLAELQTSTIELLQLLVEPRPDPATVRLNDAIMIFPDLVQVEKQVGFLDDVADAPLCSSRARAAEAIYQRQFVIVTAHSTRLDRGIMHTWDGIDKFKNCIRPGAFLGEHHESIHAIENFELVRTVAAIAVECIQIMDAMETELPDSVLMLRFD